MCSWEKTIKERERRRPRERTSAIQKREERRMIGVVLSCLLVGVAAQPGERSWFSGFVWFENFVIGGFLQDRKSSMRRRGGSSAMRSTRASTTSRFVKSKIYHSQVFPECSEMIFVFSRWRPSRATTLISLSTEDRSS